MQSSMLLDPNNAEIAANFANVSCPCFEAVAGLDLNHSLNYMNWSYKVRAMHLPLSLLTLRVSINDRCLNIDV